MRTLGVLDGGYDDYQIYDHFYSFACSKQALHPNTISSSDSSFMYLHSAKAMLRFPRTFFRASLTVHTPETHPNRLANMNRKPDINLQTHGIFVYYLGAKNTSGFLYSYEPQSPSQVGDVHEELQCR